MPPKKTRTQERRTTARADARLSMRVDGPQDDDGLTHIVTESENISTSGVYCMSPHYVAPLSKVALTIVLPRTAGRTRPQHLLKCEGVVVRCMTAAAASKERQYQMACSFLGLDDGERRLLDDFVTWRNLQALRKAATPARPKRAKPRTKKAVANGHAKRVAARPAAKKPRARSGSRSRRASS
jgi:hypothetical protein